MAEVILSDGSVALVDDEDFPAVACHGWQPREAWNGFYATASIPKLEAAERGMKVKKQDGKRTQITLHRFIMGPGPSIDHINGNKLDCRRENLRWSNNILNQANRFKITKGTSKYKGVGYHKRQGKWQALIGRYGRSEHLGYFDSEVEAARVWDAEAMATWGEHARLNFPTNEENQ